MASTRNRNTPNDYAQFIQQNDTFASWQTYKNGANGFAYDTRLPGNGLNPGHLPPSTLSNNPTDIESFLFGINSTNLVTPAGPLTPSLVCLQTANVFQTAPVIMPVPQAIPKGQRPFIP